MSKYDFNASQLFPIYLSNCNKPFKIIALYFLTMYVNIVKGRIKPVPLEDFGAHVSRMHADRDKWFEMEYNVSAFITPFSLKCIFAEFFKLNLL